MHDVDFAVLNKEVDVSREFRLRENAYFLAMRAVEFDPQSGRGRIEWLQHRRNIHYLLNQVTMPYEEKRAWEYPPDYPESPVLPFALEMISPRTVRLRMTSRPEAWREEPSLMLAGDVPRDDSWQAEGTDEGARFSSEFGSVGLRHDPWRIELRDASGRLLTATKHLSDSVVSLRNVPPTPFSFVCRPSDLARRMAASFSLAPDEKLYGCGESFTRLNKRGQRLVLWTSDALGAQGPEMYKPVPFFLSSRGWGAFVHSSAPLTFDLGHDCDDTATLYSGDDELDLFLFIGSPKEVLSEYTALTGRSPTPPLWSFGLWMSRLTYKSEEETRQVASDLREHRIPCDVIHLDTGWFERDWRCDYRFSPSRFPTAERMLSDLKEQGFRISLWQLPYFVPDNDLFPEIIREGYAVRDGEGRLPTEDAILDFSNPRAVSYYQELLAGLLKLGVAAIKADFGEAAPLHGAYASGRTGWYEHNLYPLRYNRAVADITRKIKGEAIIWARSAWAGSQRYPTHWGGDAENTDSAMAATMRAGVSFGLSGFAFWSHDIGGFVRPSPAPLYRRWMPFGMLTSHSRCHGAPPKEPWPYGEEFEADFRRAVELKYRLMPYVYAQAVSCSQSGWPMLRALFLEYPDDPTAWLVEDEYFFGADLLVAPLIEEAAGRNVYLPPGRWIDYQTGGAREGAAWHYVEPGPIPAALFVREGAALPHAPLAQCTDWIDWSEIELRVFGAPQEARALFSLPESGQLHELRLVREGEGFRLAEDPFPGEVRWTITTQG